MLNKTKLKKKFNDEGIQIPIRTINVLNAEVTRMADRWVHNTKEANVRRLSPDLLWAALGKCSQHQWEKGSKV